MELGFTKPENEVEMAELLDHDPAKGLLEYNTIKCLEQSLELYKPE